MRRDVKSRTIWLLAPLGAVLAGMAYGASCDRIEDLDARLACFDRLADCASIAADAERLACFEGLDPDATAQSAPTEPEDDPFPVKGRSRSDGDGAAAETLTASITRVRRDARGIVYLFLDNGQVWRETARSRFNYQAGMGVQISTGMLGSTNLIAEGMKKHAKVRRVE